MSDDFKFRLVVDRTTKKNIMSPEFRSDLDLDKEINLKGTIEILGTKEINGNIQVHLCSYFETDSEKSSRLKK